MANPELCKLQRDEMGDEERGNPISFVSNIFKQGVLTKVLFLQLGEHLTWGLS